MEHSGTSTSMEWARAVTRKASRQAYWTIKLLVEEPLRADAYRAYAYLRWLDDEVDARQKSRKGRLVVVERAKKILKGMTVQRLKTDERLLVELVAGNPDRGSKLYSFLNKFVAIIEFDAKRKGRLVKRQELDWYVRTLAVAVTDGVDYFVDNGGQRRDDKDHYQAAMGAHIVHMLRDMRGDLEEGYVNVEKEEIDRGLIPSEVESRLVRTWVKRRVGEAREKMRRGRAYIDRLPVGRVKVTAILYCLRFEGVLGMIEEDGYILRSSYPRRSRWWCYGIMVKAMVVAWMREKLVGRRISYNVEVE